jgi:hypothetical protein
VSRIAGKGRVWAVESNKPSAGFILTTAAAAAALSSFRFMRSEQRFITRQSHAASTQKIFPKPLQRRIIPALPHTPPRVTRFLQRQHQQWLHDAVWFLQ